MYAIYYILTNWQFKTFTELGKQSQHCWCLICVWNSGIYYFAIWQTTFSRFTSGTTQLMLIKLLSLDSYFQCAYFGMYSQYCRRVFSVTDRQKLAFVNIDLVFVFEIVTLETFFTKILLDSPFTTAALCFIQIQLCS